ncbi:hypothetical protein (nucleomorph) [Guillardia theta]|uniref:Uncharacterized protein n=1 Tax=Guillardia theta TaxID=55529 RepID=Q98S58_GUITH|nr:hypothetical protein GTHECHR3080 [Guillardia theta]AAK39724.1 hypothetical protein [Guillardia theta]
MADLWNSINLYYKNNIKKIEDKKRNINHIDFSNIINKKSTSTKESVKFFSNNFKKNYFKTNTILFSINFFKFKFFFKSAEYLFCRIKNFSRIINEEFQEFTTSVFKILISDTYNYLIKKLFKFVHLTFINDMKCLFLNVGNLKFVTKIKKKLKTKKKIFFLNNFLNKIIFSTFSFVLLDVSFLLKYKINSLNYSKKKTTYLPRIIKIKILNLQSFFSYNFKTNNFKFIINLGDKVSSRLNFYFQYLIYHEIFVTHQENINILKFILNFINRPFLRSSNAFLEKFFYKFHNLFTFSDCIIYSIFIHSLSDYYLIFKNDYKFSQGKDIKTYEVYIKAVLNIYNQFQSIKSNYIHHFMINFMKNVKTIKCCNFILVYTAFFFTCIDNGVFNDTNVWHFNNFDFFILKSFNDCFSVRTIFHLEINLEKIINYLKINKLGQYPKKQISLYDNVRKKKLTKEEKINNIFENLNYCK